MKFLLYPAAIYLCLLLVLYLFQRSMLYFPDKSIYTPAEAGVPEMRIVNLETEDGLQICAWYREPFSSSLPTIVYYHGNAGNIANRGFIIKPYLDEGFGVLLVTYRGYSGNPGRPSEEGLYKDGRAALEFLKNGKNGHCIILFGESIGSAVAIQMAVEYSVKAIILQSPFSSIHDVAKIHYAFFLPFQQFIKDKFDSASKGGKIHSPVFILHGKDDIIIPPELSRKLYETLSQPKEVKYIPGRGHNNLFEPALVIQFIKNHVKCTENHSLLH